MWPRIGVYPKEDSGSPRWKRLCDSTFLFSCGYWSCTPVGERVEVSVSSSLSPARPRWQEPPVDPTLLSCPACYTDNTGLLWSPPPLPSPDPTSHQLKRRLSGRAVLLMSDLVLNVNPLWPLAPVAEYCQIKDWLKQKDSIKWTISPPHPPQPGTLFKLVISSVPLWKLIFRLAWPLSHPYLLPPWHSSLLGNVLRTAPVSCCF